MKIYNPLVKNKLKKAINPFVLKNYIHYKYTTLRNRFFYGKKRILRFVKIEVSKECPSKCKTCNFWRTKTLMNGEEICTKKLSFDQMKKLGRELKEIGCGIVHLHGGEPFLYPEILELIEYLKELGVYVQTDTNGLLINKKVAERFVKTGIDSISFSLDAPTRELNDFIRGVNGAYDKLINAIKLIQAADKDNKIYKNINATVSVYNIGHIDKILDVAHTLGISSVTFGNVVSFGKNVKEICDKTFGKKVGSVAYMNPDLMVKDKLLIERKIEEIKKKANNLGISVGGLFLSLSPELIISGKRRLNSICNYFLYRCIIDIYGNVYPCDFLRYPLGNIHQNSLKKILGQNFTEFYDIYRKNWKNLEICEFCCYG